MVAKDNQSSFGEEFGTISQINYQNMHIVYITHEYPTVNLAHGGVGSFVKFISRSLVDLGFEVSVIGVYPIDKAYLESDNGVNVYRIPKSKFRFLKFIDNVKRMLIKLNEINQKQPIDIVEGSELNFAFFPKKTPYKKVIRLHGGHHFFALELGKKPAFWRSFQEKKSFRKADNFISVSEYVGNQTKKYLQLDFNFKTIYNSIDANKFQLSNNTTIDEQTLLFVGTICEKKGIKDLVISMQEVIKHIPNINLKIVGRDWFFPDGSSYIAYLKRYITNETKDNIEIVGPVPHDEIPSYLNSARICIYPSHMESFGLVIIESMFMEKTVIASNIGPFHEILRNNQTGLLVRPKDSGELAKAIITLLNNGTLSKQLAANAKEDAVKRFKPEVIVKKNIEFYKSIM